MNSLTFLLLVFPTRKLLCESNTDLVKKQNIILILADDLGVNDVSWNNPSAKTPYLHELATSDSGTILENAYSLPVCSPSRAALLSGVYPFRLGLQRGWGKHSPEGLPLNTTMLPELLKKEGYTTHGFGKWHLGFCSESYTPLKRGFDSYFGLFVGDDDEHTQAIQTRNKKGKGKKNVGRVPRAIRSKQFKEGKGGEAKKNKYKDKRKGNNRFKDKFKGKNKNNGKGNKGAHRDKNKTNQLSKEEKIRQQLLRKPTKFGSNIYGSKAIEVIQSSDGTKPFFIYLALFTKSYPREVTKRRGSMEKAVAENRRKKLSDMDETLLDIVEALKSSGHYDDTVIFFISDNGARAVKNPKSRSNPNYPLRGSKGTVYEGGTKVPSFIHSPAMRSSKARYTGLFHMVDVLPTLLHWAGVERMTGIDGFNHWYSMYANSKSPRKTMIYNIDDNFVPAVLNGPGIRPKFQISVREDDFKLVWGQPKMLHRSYRDAKSDGGLVLDSQVLELYNLEKDPTESHNIANQRVDMVLKLKNFALNHYRDLIPPRFMGLQTTNQVLDSKSDFGGLSGWCRAVVKTACGPLEKSSYYRGLQVNDMAELFYGTVPGTLDTRTFCVSSLE